MGQLNRCQRAVFMHPIRHQRQAIPITVVPQTGFLIWQDITRRVDIAFLGCDHSPATLGFHPAHGRHTVGHGMSHAIAVRHLEKTVMRGYRANCDWLEQDVITWIAAHLSSFIV